MPLTINDDELRALGMDESQARIEIACRLFEAGQMAFEHAAKLAHISEGQMIDEIERRAIPRYRYTSEHLRQDLEAIEKMRALERAGK